MAIIKRFLWDLSVGGRNLKDRPAPSPLPWAGTNFDATKSPCRGAAVAVAGCSRARPTSAEPAELSGGDSKFWFHFETARGFYNGAPFFSHVLFKSNRSNWRQKSRGLVTADKQLAFQAATCPQVAAEEPSPTAVVWEVWKQAELCLSFWLFFLSASTKFAF